MKKVEQYKAELVAFKVLQELFYNFKSSYIDFLATNDEFRHSWNELVEENPGCVLGAGEFFKMFCQLSTETQAFVLDFCMNNWKIAAEESINFELAILKDPI